MSVPTRIERKRRRGWRMPAGAVDVGRGTMWGNPFHITRSSDFHGLPGSWFLLDEDGATYHPDQDTERSARQKATDLFAAWVIRHEDGAPSVDRIRAELAGRDLVCWCPRREPCHADVLLEIANSTGPLTRPPVRAAEPLAVRSEPVGQHPVADAGGGTCPGCGSTRSMPSRIVLPIEGDVSVTGLSALGMCRACGYEPDPTG